MTRLLLAFLAVALTASATDFANFTYPFPESDTRGVPDALRWMSLKVPPTVTLSKGRHDFPSEPPLPIPNHDPALILSRVLYGNLTSRDHLDAVVILTYYTGGTAHWQYVYIYRLDAGPAKLLGWLRTGSRSRFGLYDAALPGPELQLDLLDPDHSEGDCCSAGFVRLRYRYKNGYFVESGHREYGNIEQTRRRK